MTSKQLWDEHPDKSSYQWVNSSIHSYNILLKAEQELLKIDYPKLIKEFKVLKFNNRSKEIQKKLLKLDNETQMKIKTELNIQ